MNLLKTSSSRTNIGRSTRKDWCRYRNRWAPRHAELAIINYLDLRYPNNR